MNCIDERVKQLKALKSQGIPTSQIAIQMGVTKNAIIGKIDRLSRNFSVSPTKPVAAPAKPVAIQPAQEREFPVKMTNGKFATILTVNNNTCRWPFDAPNGKGFHFCGRAPSAGLPYCEVHSRRAYQPEKRKQ